MNLQEPNGTAGEAKGRSRQLALESWKEIGAYIQRDAKTARRWEKEEGLPIHRHSHHSRSSVYAHPSEIDAWRASRKAAAEPSPVRPLWRSPVFAVTMLLCLIMVGNGIRPVSAQQVAGTKAVRQVWVSRPSEDPAYSVPSLDGRYIGYTDWETGDLGVRDLTTGAGRHLTNTGGWESSGDYAQRPVISPDSRQIVYTWFVEKGLKNELRVVPLKGGAPRILFSSSDEYVAPQAWTPDGSQLLVVHTLANRTSQIAMLSVRDGSMRALKSFGWQNLDASLSPDGRFVAYDSPTDTKTQARDIFVLTTDGSRETAVVQSPADDVEPVWSPDGSRILFLSDRTGAISLWSMSIENGSPKGPAELVKADMGRLESMAMSRNGTLYYVIPGTSSPNIYSAELGSDMKVSKPPVLAVERFVNSNNGPSLSSDGQYLAYDSFRPGGTALVVRALKTGEEREVPSQVRVGMIFGYGPMWFPDGRSLLVLSRDSERPGFSFYQVDVATGKAEMLHHTDQGLQGYKLSPDGKTIFFTEVTTSTSVKTVTTRLLRFDLGTRRETELKKGEFFIAVAVSPDSKQLAYLVQDVGTQRSSSYLAVMPAEGGESREVFRGTPWLDGSRYNTLAWTPDQRYLLFVRANVGDNGPSVLWRVPIAGGPPEQMGISMLARIKSPQIVPDLGRIFFSVNPNSPSEVWALQNFLPKTQRNN